MVIYTSATEKRSISLVNQCFYGMLKEIVIGKICCFADLFHPSKERVFLPKLDFATNFVTPTLLHLL